MKKNADYVGVDEKYIPEDEKYVSDSVADSIKKDAKEAYENLDKTKLKKGVKTATKMYLAYIIVVGIIALTIIGITLFVIFSVLSKF